MDEMVIKRDDKYYCTLNEEKIPRDGGGDIDLADYPLGKSEERKREFLPME